MKRPDLSFMLVLIEELITRYPFLQFSYIIPDKGYDAEEIHHGICEFFDIIPIIVRKKMVYPKRFTRAGYLLCLFRLTMKPRGIERTFGLVKQNRYRMEITNFYKGIDNVTIHTIERDIVLTHDIIFDYIKSGKISPVLNLNY